MIGALVIRPIRAGDEMVVEVEGGFARRQAPCDGLLVETDSRDLFLPVDRVVEALRLLGKTG